MTDGGLLAIEPDSDLTFVVKLTKSLGNVERVVDLQPVRNLLIGGWSQGGIRYQS